MTCLPFPDTKPDARIDLFCFPHAGGSSAVFRLWNAVFPDWIAVHPVEFPGRGTRMMDPLQPDAKTLVQGLARDIGPALTRPFAFFGHSMGSVVAYRILLELSPEKEALAFFSAGGRSPLSTDPLPRRAHLNDDDLIEEIRRFGGSPPEVLDNRELMDLLLPIIRGDFALGETLKSETNVPKISCPIHILGGTEDVEVPTRSLSTWQYMTTKTFDITLFPGEHFFLHQSETLPAIRNRVVDILARHLIGRTSTSAKSDRAHVKSPDQMARCSLGG